MPDTQERLFKKAHQGQEPLLLQVLYPRLQVHHTTLHTCTRHFLLFHIISFFVVIICRRFYKKISTDQFTEESTYVIKRGAPQNGDRDTNTGAGDSPPKQKKKKKKTATPRKKKKKKEGDFPDLSGMNMDESALDEYQQMINADGAGQGSGGEGGDEEKKWKRKSGSFQICDKRHICVRELRCGGIQDTKKAIFGGVDGVSYDTVEREWKFPIDAQDKVVKNYKKLGLSCSPVPKEPLNALVNNTTQNKQIHGCNHITFFLLLVQ